ncbi:MAG: ABC transporter substrate-binding protein [Gordonia sp. (in: high G+C Gram-positive bacteria)]
MPRPPRRRSRASLGLLVAWLVAAVAVLTGCTTAPLDVGAIDDPATAHLRDGPRVADLPNDDPVPVETAPQASPRADRIIAIDRNGTLGATVFALGLGPKVVAVGGSTTFPAAAGLPVVTDPGHAINVEKVLAQRPTVVLAARDSTPAGILDQLRAAGLDVAEFTGDRSIAGTPALIRDVAKALGAQAAGERLVARTQGQIDAARRSLPDPTGDPTMAFLYIRGDRLILLAGPGSGADDLIAGLGGKDAGTEAGLTAAFTMVSTESLMRADPDVILVMTQGAESVGGLDGVAALPAVAGTGAGRARRIIAMEETEILAFGPDTGLVLRSLGEAIYR